MPYKQIKKDGTPAKKPGRKPDPNRVKPVRRSGRYGPRPHTWVIGEDAGHYKHSMYLPWLRAKAQARFRDEDWQLTFEEFYELWKDHWPKRGRAVDALCMSRMDFDAEWSVANCRIVDRADHLKRQGEYRRSKNAEIKYSKGRK